MYSTTSFDFVAPSYDRHFTNTSIGRAQRNIVWKILSSEIGSRKDMDVLDIGCGTGEDSIMLGNLNHSVHAIDLSEGMIDAAKQKNKLRNVQFERVNITEFATERKFDVIFSNFAALNCLNREELAGVAKNAATMLKPDGKLVLVFFGKYCWMEKLYFLLKGNRRAMSRRNNTFEVNLGEGNLQKTWFYSAQDIVEIFDDFRLLRKRPVGLFIPPSYTEQVLSRYPFLTWLLKGMDSVFGRISALADRGDHMCVVMDLRKY